MDRSWPGTVKPMKWFDYYFDFINAKHSKYLFEIFNELMSSRPSFDAMPYTRSVVSKITPYLLSSIKKDFITFCADRVLSSSRDNISYLTEKLKELYDADMIQDVKLKKIARLILLIEDHKKQLPKDKIKKAKDTISDFLYPDDI